MIDLVTYAIFRGFLGAVGLLPMGLAAQLARSLARLLFLIARRRRAIALDNLRHAFGEQRSEAELRRIARASFENIALNVVEFIFLPRLEKDVETIAEGAGVEHIRDGLERGRGVLFLVCHFGNWELLGQLSLWHGFPLTAIARPFKNPRIYHYIKRTRERSGLKILGKKWISRDVAEVLGANECLAIFVDQRANRDGEKVEFLGRIAQTTRAPALFARKHEPTVIPVFPVRLGLAKHFVYIEEPVPVIRTNDPKDDVHRITAAYTKVIEKYVTEYPEQWLWFHRRWRLSK